MPDAGHGLLHALSLKLDPEHSACVLASPIAVENRLCLRIGRLVFFLLPADDGMDRELPHNLVNPVFTVTDVVEMIDSECHSTVAKYVPKPFIILSISSVSFMFSASCSGTDRRSHLW